MKQEKNSEEVLLQKHILPKTELSFSVCGIWCSTWLPLAVSTPTAKIKYAHNNEIARFRCTKKWTEVKRTFLKEHKYMRWWQKDSAILISAFNVDNLFLPLNSKEYYCDDKASNRDSTTNVWDHLECCKFSWIGLLNEV